mmetsp:Transcript_27605/g.49797  ORF Transcript_27605/g.49797 Transcript_27605/m.49797 type:complete len:488 (+) Transcript_27605:367-1830(+)|eukprot:CAMPEP_0204898480 /NCGR_PEP_ID=MMETSP1397-20131031/1318_1 /ASSEMBLY_ACC=CAM_ASM_000891 /TAXON_ID=49980 /ORGANISM="Climacostomum Climacostomum virens, Strain Stock W-24" /LENGTH=487 /DNA_ID=CAMNT_0052066341 /DNA_START=316 /DNA_END=1779 /DNA_ORIENTATION=-
MDAYNIPQVSALSNPPPAVAAKRFFTPSYDSGFNPAKKRRLASGPQPVHGTFIPTSEEKELMQLERDKQEAERQKLLNQAYYKRNISRETSMPTSSRSSVGPLPFSPHSDNRMRLTAALSLEENVLREIASRPKFRAKPIPRSHHVPPMVIKSSSRPLTVPREFNLSKVPESIHSKHSSQELSPGFKARPLNKQIFDQPDFVPMYEHKATVPIEVKLRTNERQRSYSIDEGDSQQGFKARPMPVFPPVFTQKSTQPLTVPEMPHLLTEERGFQKQQAFEEQIRSSEEKHQGFVSRPMPIFSTPEPKPKTFTPTQFSPFNLYSTPKATQDTLGAAQIPQFIAKPMPDFSNPFVPKKAPTEVTFEPFEMHSDQRAVFRSVFDEQLNEKRRREEEMLEAEAAKARAIEEAEVQSFRRQSKFTALPMPHYNFFEPKHSEKPLTEPKSPLLETKLRANLSQSGQIGVISDMSTINLSDNSMDLDLDLMDLVE